MPEQSDGDAFLWRQMIPAYLYTPLYFHSMLLVVIGCALFYWSQHGTASLDLFNQVAMVIVGIGVILLIGTRPISGIFIDMVGYARSYERVQQGAEGSSSDGLFNGLMRLCGPFLPAEGFFLVCSIIYVAPLAFATWRIHGLWAFPAFLACLTAFSFWGYAVNGVRNGMATSVLMLAFAFYDKPVVMFPLIATAWGLHGSVLLPALAFVIVRYVRRTEIWLAFWILCAATSLLVGNAGQLLVSHFNPFAWDDRIEGYIVAAEDYGFRANFLAYSILPVLVTLLIAAPTRARLHRFGALVKRNAAFSWVSGRAFMGGGGVRMVTGSCTQGADAKGGLALTCLGLEKRSMLQARLPALTPNPSTFERPGVSAGKVSSVPRASLRLNAWKNLSWVRMLRSDPFYARLVNTYLFANAVWVLLIQVRWSNRFAYLSWFMMPWVLLYPFVPGKVNVQPRAGLIAAILTVHYLFTYFMWVVVYRMRFG